MVLPYVYDSERACRFVHELQEHLSKFWILSVVDVYDYIKRDNPLLELPSLTYKENMIGWDIRDIFNIQMRLVRGGVAIELPEPYNLDDTQSLIREKKEGSL